MDCTSELPNTGQLCREDLGVPVLFCYSTEKGGFTLEQIRDPANLKEWAKRDTGRLHIVPMNGGPAEFPPNELAQETLNMGQTKGRYPIATPDTFKMDLPSAYIAREFEKKVNGQYVNYFIVYHTGKILARIAANGTDFEPMNGILNAVYEKSSENASQKEAFSVTSNDPSGDIANMAVEQLAGNYTDLKELIAGRLALFGSQAATEIRVVFESEDSNGPIYVSTDAPELAKYADEFILLDSTGSAVTIDSVAAPTAGDVGKGRVIINGVGIITGEYTLSYKTPANVTAVSLQDYDFSISTISVTIP